MTKINFFFHNRASQRGVALIVSMVMLVAITLIGVFAMSNSHLEWLMTSNSRFQLDADLRAYAAVRDGIGPGSGSIENDHDHVNPSAGPPPADPQVPASWDPPNSLGAQPARSITTPGTNQYYWEALSCAVGAGLTGPACTSNSCNSGGNVCTYTYLLWGRASDGKGTNRIVQATVIKQETAQAITRGRRTVITYTPSILSTTSAEVAP